MGGWLLVTDTMSDTEIFYCQRLSKSEENLNLVKNRRSAFWFLRNFVPAFMTEYSFASHKDLEEHIGVSRFISKGKIVTISFTGKVSWLTWDVLNGGNFIEFKKYGNFVLLNE